VWQWDGRHDRAGREGEKRNSRETPAHVLCEAHGSVTNFSSEWQAPSSACRATVFFACRALKPVLFVLPDLHF
jgi:hypothetical protein